MATGVSAIVSDIAGCRDLVSNNETGLVFPVDRHIKLAASIKRLAEDASLRENFGQSGREFIQKHYSASRMAIEYEMLYERLTSHHSPKETTVGSEKI